MSGRTRALAAVVVLALLAVVSAWWTASSDGVTRVVRGPVLENPPSAPSDVVLPQPASRVETERAGGGSATAGPGVDALATQPATSDSSVAAGFTGWLVDELGEPLAEHELELFDTPKTGAVPPMQQPVATAVSRRDGRFQFTGALAGTCRLHVQGPGEGDQPILRSRRTEPRLGFDRDEGSIYLVLPKAGIFDATVVVDVHAAFWVLGSIEVEDFGAHATPHSQFDWWGRDPEAFVQDEATPVQDQQPTAAAPGVEQPLGSGPVIPIHGPRYDRVWSDAFLAAALQPTDRLLVVGKRGYLTQTHHVDGTAFQDVGVVKLACVAGFAVTAVVGDSADAVRPTEVIVKETGGGRPDRVTRVAPEPWFEDRIDVWCDRRTGRCEITVKAPDGFHGTATVDLSLPGDELPVIRVTLVRDE